MAFDRVLARGTQARQAHPAGARILYDAWLGVRASERAPSALAVGDVATAGAIGGGGWELLAKGDLIGALNASREGERRPGDRLLEAECLLASGAVVAGLSVLERLHEGAFAPATVASARHRHGLGDYAGAMRVAANLPMHAGLALTAARSALALKRPGTAFEFLEPVLYGVAPVPDAATASATALITASTLAQTDRIERLKRLAAHLIEAPDLIDEMLPAVARVAWMAGRGGDAWKRAEGDSPYALAARLELAVLTGDTALAERTQKAAGTIAAPSMPALKLMLGDFDFEEGAKIFKEGVVVHVWRTHPTRWQPWIDAALDTAASVHVFDLGRHDVPPPTEVPHVVLDDGALIEMFNPKPVAPRPPSGQGVWIDEMLGGVNGIGHRWPSEERELLQRSVTIQPRPELAEVRVAGEDYALAHAQSGLPMVITAPPGDPFWNGVLPSRAWPNMRVVRADPRRMWQGVGARVADQVSELLLIAAQSPGGP